MIMKDILSGTEKIRNIMRGGATEYYQHPQGIIKTGKDSK